MFGGGGTSDYDLHIPKKKRVDVAQVEIYYETSCPYSLMFLNETLRAAWDDENLTARMDVKLFPFGNAQSIPEENISEGYHFWHEDATYPITVCQHGETECLGNSIQACAIDELKDQQKYVPFVICMASYGYQMGVEKTSYECGQKQNVDMKSLKKCVESGRAAELIEAYGNATRKTFSSFNASGVPFTVVQGNSINGDDGEPHLFEHVCSWLKEPRPAYCRNYITPSGAGDELACGDSKEGKAC